MTFEGDEMSGAQIMSQGHHKICKNDFPPLKIDDLMD